MHVVLIIPRFYPFWGGTEIRMKRVAEALSARGFHFTVLTRRLKWSLPARETVGEISIVRLPAPLFLFSFFVSRWLARHASDIDAVHSFRLDKCALPASGPARTHALPHIADIITNEAEKMLTRNSGRKTLLRIDAGTRMIHCLSAATADALADFGISRKKLWLRGNAVDTDVFHPGETRHPAPLTVLFSGRLERQKGTDILIDAWKRLPPAISAQAHLILAGSGKWADRLRHAAVGMANVTFLGTQAREQMPDLYRRADIYVQPSRFEGMSNAILEALASGLAIVTTDIGANRGVIDNGRDGILIPNEDAQSLADALSRLIENADLRAALGMHARRKAVAEFAFERLFDDYEAAYRTLAKGTA